MTEQLQHLANRYPGVKPFSVNEKLLFFGRNHEIAALKRLISINQTIVLYGKSGYGKSSLINAGIIPDLKAEGSFLYFTIRFNNYSDRDEEQKNLPPAETVKKRLRESTGTNLYADLQDLIPGESSFWYWIKQSQATNKKSKFILFFDQFEELFTYPKEQIAEFAEQLSDILYDTVPTNYRIRVSELYEQDLLPDELHNFLEKRAEVKVVFSIRSDRLSLMNSLKNRLPAILQNCYELNALNEEDAAAAITEPARLSQDMGFKTPPFEFTAGTIDKILKSIANQQDGKIEAATLQIVGRYIEDILVAEKGINLVTEEALGDITDIFQQYYESILNKLPQEERSKVQGLIEDDLIEGGKRNPLTAGFIQRKTGLSLHLLDELERSSLLRKERDANGRILYEISHDTLIAAINKVGNSRRIIEEQQKSLRLEQEIDNERKRVEELSTARNNALKRLKIARIMSGIAILMAGVAILFLLKAQTQEAKANKNAEMAKVNADKAQKTLSDLNREKDFAEVNRLISIGDEFIEYKNHDRACYTYDSAFSILARYKNEQLPKPDLQRKEELEQKIKSLCAQ